MEVAAVVRAGLDVAGVVDPRQRRGRQVGRPADQLGHLGRRPLEHVCEDLRVAVIVPDGVEARHVAVPAGGQLAGEQPLELLGEQRVLLRVGVEPRAATRLELGAAIDALAEVRERLSGT